MATLYCPKCGYNLTGLTEDRCPECEARFDPQQLKTDQFYAARYSLVAIFQLVLVPIAFAVALPCLFFAVLMIRGNDEPLPIGYMAVVLVGGAAAVYGYFLGKGYGKARLVCRGADRLSAIFTSPVGYGVLFSLVIFTQTAAYIFAEVYWVWHIH